MTADLTPTPLSHVEFLTKRPKLFTAHGSLGEILAFCDGYESARRHMELSSSVAPRPGPTPSDALVWLASQCEYVEGRTFPLERLELILKRFGSSEAALAALDAYAADQRNAARDQPQ
jgi:hypothetical protein